MLARISAPHFVAGIDLDTRRAAPIVAYMRAWPLERIQDYCQRKGWTVELFD